MAGQEFTIIMVLAVMFGGPVAVSLVAYCIYLVYRDPPVPYWLYRQQLEFPDERSESSHTDGEVANLWSTDNIEHRDVVTEFSRCLRGAAR